MAAKYSIGGSTGQGSAGGGGGGGGGGGAGKAGGKKPTKAWTPPPKVSIPVFNGGHSAGAAISGLLGKANTGGAGGAGGGGGGGGGSAARAANDSTRKTVDHLNSLIGSFGTQRDTKLGNIAQAYTASDKQLLATYGAALSGLEGTADDNEKAEAAASFGNISNAVRERGEILAEIAAQGAGETDQLQAQLQAMRNYSANQTDVNRSFFDTLRSVNSSITALNNDVSTSRQNMFHQAEADRESTWANYYNQAADTYTQIFNVENSNTTGSYAKGYGDAGANAAKMSGSSYTRQAAKGLDAWDGKGTAREGSLTNNQAAVINLGKQKRAEGSTLRSWT